MMKIDWIKIVATLLIMLLVALAYLEINQPDEDKPYEKLAPVENPEIYKDLFEEIYYDCL